ncbi:uncharacterized protein METZ01_LOCUS364430, partial [marine metagenome]
SSVKQLEGASNKSDSVEKAEETIIKMIENKDI